MDIPFFTIHYNLNISDASELEETENCLRVFEYGSVLNDIPSYYILQNSGNNIKTQLSAIDFDSTFDNFIDTKLKIILQNETISIQNQFLSLANQYADTDYYDLLINISENLEITVDDNFNIDKNNLLFINKDE